MINDDYEYDIAASMDDLDAIDLNTPRETPSKLGKFQKTTLPEIDENSPFDSQNHTPTSSEVFQPSGGNSTPTKMKKSVSISSNEPEQISPDVSDNNNDDDDDDSSGSDHCNTSNSNKSNNSDKQNNNNNKKNKNISNNNHVNNNKNGENKPQATNNTIAGTHRKFIVTRMDSNAILRPEAEKLRNWTERSNAATIQFPCSSGINHRPALASLFGNSTTITPHLDKRFFDTSLVEVRVTADSTQSLNVISENQVDGHSIWQRRNEKPKVKKVLKKSATSRSISQDLLLHRYFCVFFYLFSFVFFT